MAVSGDPGSQSAHYLDAHAPEILQTKQFFFKAIIHLTRPAVPGKNTVRDRLGAAAFPIFPSAG
jgi:hypothetical protein